MRLFAKLFKVNLSEINVHFLPRISLHFDRKYTRNCYFCVVCQFFTLNFLHFDRKYTRNYYFCGVCVTMFAVIFNMTLCSLIREMDSGINILYISLNIFFFF